MLTLRRLGDWEIDDILAMAERFTVEADMKAAFSVDECAGHWTNLPDKVAIGLYSKDQLVGILAGYIAPQFFTGVRLAQELFWYVAPEHRGSFASLKMLDLFEEWAKEKKVFGITMVSLAKGSDSVPRLYAKRGYVGIEAHHLLYL